MRDRMSKSPVGELLTLTDDISLYDCENFILEGAANRYEFAHWFDHLVPLFTKLTKDYRERSYSCGSNFTSLREVVSNGLKKEGFVIQGNELLSAINEEALNKEIIAQYTDETSLYSEINKLLRAGHTGDDVSFSGLTGWICQLAVAIRQHAEFPKVSSRGTILSKEDVQKYSPGTTFVWAPFTSASKDINSCFGGNVIFKLKPVSALSERDLRSPRDISSLSVYPGEQEVLLPMCCAYRVTSNEFSKGRPLYLPRYFRSLLRGRFRKTKRLPIDERYAK